MSPILHHHYAQVRLCWPIPVPCPDNAIGGTGLSRAGACLLTDLPMCWINLRCAADYARFSEDVAEIVRFGTQLPAQDT